MQVHTLLYLVRDDRRVSEALICLALSRRVAWYVWQKHAHCGEPCTCTVQSAAERCEPTANRRYYTYFLNKYINTLLNINIIHTFCTSFFFVIRLKKKTFQNLGLKCGMEVCSWARRVPVLKLKKTLGSNFMFDEKNHLSTIYYIKIS